MASPAQSAIEFLSNAEVAAQLSPREFAKLCGVVDELYGKTVIEVGNVSGTTPKKAIRTIGAKFDVLDIARTPKELNVTVCAERSGGAVRITVK
jgi:hypothetical protein